MAINVKVIGIGDVSIEDDSILLDLSKQIYGDDYKKYLGARINNQIYQLRKHVREGMEILFLDIKDVDGYRIYSKTITAIFIMACKELYKDANVTIEHSIGSGLYAELEHNRTITFSKTEEIEKKMYEIISKDYEILRDDYTREEAIKIFKDYGYEDKVRLFKSIDKEKRK